MKQSIHHRLDATSESHRFPTPSCLRFLDPRHFHPPMRLGRLDVGKLAKCCVAQRLFLLARMSPPRCVRPQFQKPKQAVGRLTSLCLRRCPRSPSLRFLSNPQIARSQTDLHSNRSPNELQSPRHVRCPQLTLSAQQYSGIHRGTPPTKTAPVDGRFRAII